MKIQNILWPRVAVCSEQKLYYQVDAAAGKAEESCVYQNEDETALFIEEGAKASFDTYFNGLSIGKWKKYTQIQGVELNLRLKGSAEVCLFNMMRLPNGHVVKKELKRVRVQYEEMTDLRLPFESYTSTGMFAFSVFALSQTVEIQSGFYSAQMDEKALKPVDIALNICTFRREFFVHRNMDILNRYVLNNTESELFGHVEVFISDNGKTLDIDKLGSDKIHIVPNKNVGGAGGFTRGMIEVLKNKENFPATHILMMDDDITIEPESLFRTYMILRCRKDCYEELFVGGAMLRNDEQDVQVESGASWNAGALISNKSGLKFNCAEACLYNEEEEYVEYNAWWYCCTPMSVVNEENLPLPIFIRGDDLEYGIRNRRQLMLMNGICVWHEPFENKYSSFLQYYILRNLMYDNALHYPGYSKVAFLKRLWANILREIVYYRYDNVNLICRGVEDFYKGVDFLRSTDGEQLHKEIMAAGYKAQPVEELDIPLHLPEYHDSLVRIDRSRLSQFIRYISFNGYLLPAKGDRVASMALCRPLNFYRAARVMQYDPSSGKAFITKRSHRRAFAAGMQLIGLSIKTWFKFTPSVRRFREESRELMGKNFWERYLDLK